MRNRIQIAAVLGLVTLLASGARAASPTTTVFTGGKIFTGDPGNPYVSAIAVRGQTVLATGTDAQVLAQAGKKATVYPLQGRTVIPGLNDAHLHVLVPDAIYLNNASYVPGPGPTLQDVKDLLAGAQGQVPAGAWLVVLVGTNVLDDTTATRDALDPYSANNPVWLLSWAGHGTILNTAAINSLGLALDQPDPWGGSYGRYPGTNTLNGAAHEYAEFLIWRARFATESDAELVGAYQAAAAQALQFGFTSWQDMAVGVPHARTVRVLRAANLPLRVRSICFQLSPGEGCVLDGDDGTNVTTSGIKWITDGTPIERGTYLDEDYADSPGNRGRFNLPKSSIPGILVQAFFGFPETNQLLFHSVGDGAVDNILDDLTADGSAFLWRGRRTRIEHGDLLFPDNFARMREIGAMVVQNARHLSLTALFAQRFTPQIFSELEPLRSLAAQGIPLALGTDSIGGSADPWIDVMLAAIHPTRPSEALTVEEAISAFTAGSAYAEFEETRKGTLKKGMAADLAVLSQDIFSVPIPQLPATGSLMTLVGGKIVWDAGALTPQ